MTPLHSPELAVKWLEGGRRAVRREDKGGGGTLVAARVSFCTHRQKKRRYSKASRIITFGAYWEFDPSCDVLQDVGRHDMAFKCHLAT